MTEIWVDAAWRQWWCSVLKYIRFNSSYPIISILQSNAPFLEWFFWFCSGTVQYRQTGPSLSTGSPLFSLSYSMYWLVTVLPTKVVPPYTHSNREEIKTILYVSNHTQYSSEQLQYTIVGVMSLTSKIVSSSIVLF